MIHDSDSFRTHVASTLGLGALEFLVQTAATLPNDLAGGRKGGFFSIYDKETKVMVSYSLGVYPTEKMSQYLRNATEKVTRLVGNDDHRSFQSRNEQKEHWGGGIRWGKIICAFSGFPEKIDEAISLIYAIYAQKEYLSPRRFNTDVLKLKKRGYEDNEYIEMLLTPFMQFLYVKYKIEE